MSLQSDTPPYPVDDTETATDVDRIYRDEAPRLARFFRRHARAGDDISDMVHETFSRWMIARSRRSMDRPLAYLQRVARNLLFDQTRTQTERDRRFVSFDEQRGPTIDGDQESQFHCWDLMQRYEEAVQRLTPRTREVFLLHRRDELPYQAIAARLQISSSTVEYHIARALVEIRRSLTEG